MANRIKTVSQYDGSNWVNETPIGADASNIDVVTAGSTSRNLQDVLGTPPASGNIINDINSKVSTSGGDVAATIVSDNIDNYDSSSGIGSDILTDTAATINTSTSTLWTRFNLFRKRVSNNFNNYFANSNLVGTDPGVTSTGSDSTVYTTGAINNYLSNVIGYTSASTPPTTTIASQLQFLNNRIYYYSLVGCIAMGTMPTFSTTTPDNNTPSFSSLAYYESSLAPTFFELNSGHNGIILKKSYTQACSYFLTWRLTGHMSNTNGTPAAGIKGWNSPASRWDEITFTAETLTANQYRTFNGIFTGWYGGSVNDITTISLGGRGAAYVPTSVMLIIFVLADAI